jgi:hypothetical protein
MRAIALPQKPKQPVGTKRCAVSSVSENIKDAPNSLQFLNLAYRLSKNKNYLTHRVITVSVQRIDRTLFFLILL